MKKITSTLIALTAFLALTLSAKAGMYTDTNIHNDNLFEGQSASGTWSYGPIGTGETISKIETWFKFSSSDQSFEQVHIDLGTGEGPIDSSFTSGTFNFGSNYTVNWTLNSGASLFADAANGFLSYVVSAPTIRSIDNDFTFDWAKVEVTTMSRSVPDSGATIAFLGLGMLAIAGAQRKFRLIR